ncbi:hypothetical protein IG193_04025 [Infirmifilum lucidum]|uniref:Carboxypeptidase regulatory-like domain-containing protein n=1 Tax=Infirmifilum lucidum TaxID=2776706 RepID=A0A7L9FIN8_9CREN|nr:hypothetical protein [Infirmifilum lucidum]QOJ79629.1 hypothetical protein IG193_04025 [Infirmifilum lucidum]
MVPDVYWLRLLLIVLTLGILGSLTYVLGFTGPGMEKTKNVFANTTSVNVTISVLSCSGESIGGDFQRYLTIELKGINITSKISGRDTLSVSVPPGNYSLSVYYLGSLVYKKNLTIQNSTRLSVNANITRIQFRVVGLMERGVQGYTLYIAGVTFQSGTSDIVTLWLPFGKFQYSIVYYWEKYGNVTKTGNVYVECRAISVIERVPVWSLLVFNFRLSDGSSALGLNGLVKVYYSGVLIGEVDFQSQDSLKLSGAITGLYTFSIYLHGKKIAETSVNVDEKNWNYTVTINVLRNIVVRLFDKNNQPLVSQDLSVAIVTPLGENRTYSLSDTNTFSLIEGVPGDYSLTVTSSVIGQIYSGRINIRDTSIDLQLPLVFTYVVFRPEGSETIPRGVAAKVFYVQGGREALLWATPSLSEGAESVKRVFLGVLPLGSNVKVDVSYAGVQSTVFTNIGASGVIEARVPVYDVVIRIVDRSGTPVAGCIVNVTAGTLTLSSIAQDGQVFFKNIPNTGARVTVKCKGVLVAEQVFSVASRNITITAPVASLRVRVKSWFDRPVAGVKVWITVLSGNKSLFEARDVTDQSGAAFFAVIPAPPGTTLVLKAEYGSYSYTQRLTGNENDVTIFFDVLVDTPLVKLSLMQTIALLVISLIAGIVGVVALKRYMSVSVFKHMFEVGAGEEEEEEGLVEKIRRKLQRRRVEEEEEESIFF